MRTPERLSVRHRHLLAFAPTYLQLRCGVQLLDPFVIDPLAGLAKLQVDHSRSVTPVSLRQGHDLLTQSRVAIRSRPIAVHARAHVDHSQGKTVSHPLANWTACTP